MNAGRSARAAQNSAILRIEGKKRNICSSTFTLIATHSSYSYHRQSAFVVVVADLIVLLQATNMAITIVSDKLSGAGEGPEMEPLGNLFPRRGSEQDVCESVTIRN